MIDPIDELEPKESTGSSAIPKAPPVPINPDDLHDLLAGPPEGSDEDDPLAQMRNDPNWSALINELEYIAKEARRLFTPDEEAPSDLVWDKIKDQLPTGIHAASDADPTEEPQALG